MRRQSYTGLLFVFLISLSVYSQPVDLSTAQQLANSFIQLQKSENIQLHSIDYSIRDVHIRSHAETPVYYIFNLEPVGFIIISGDFGAVPVLGFSFNSDIDPDYASPALLGWLDGYSSQITDLRANFQNKSARDQSWQHYLQGNNNESPVHKLVNSVDPLIRSIWEQGQFYNDSCPEDPDGPGGHCLAGCVAIALAQTMFYYRYPETGTGSIIYNWINNYPDSISASFENTTFRWTEMVNYIHGQANPALADLVFKAGAAVQTAYGPYGSGSYTFLCPEALVDYFRYDSSVVHYYRNDTSVSWKDTLIANLDKLQPVIYSGGTWSGGRHAFVCDGYQDTSYFHFNFGWYDGMGNGYYYLDDITPFHYDFTSNQNAVFNIFPGNDYPPFSPEYDTLTAPMGTFEDGSGTFNYPDNTNAYWLIESEPGSFIMLYFNSFNTCNEDRLKIYDGGDTNSVVLGIFSGNEIPPAIASSGNRMLIHFSSDSHENDKGWYAYYSSIAQPYCQEWSDHTDIKGNILDGSGLIYDYADQTNCYWHIHPQGYSTDSVSGITLYIHEFASEQGADLLTIYEGPTINHPVLETISGMDYPDEIISNSNEMLIHFKTNESITNAGFYASYEVNFPVYCQDTILLTEISGIIGDGSGPKLYSNNSDCYWLIESEAADTITLKFTEFDLEYGYDWIEVLDPTDNPPTVLRHLTGNQIPQDIKADHGAMLLHFHSDISIQKAGWEAEYFIGTLDIPEAGILKMINIRPNPAYDQICLDISSQQRQAMIIQLINISGDLVHESSHKISEGENTVIIDCRNVPAGVYLVKIRSENYFIYRKVIIQ